MRLRVAAFPTSLGAHKAIASFIYLAAYVGLDRVGFIQPYGPSGITAWNPGTGLSFFLVLAFGVWTIPFLFIAPFLADLVNGTIIQPWSIEILSVALVGGIYSIALIFLQRANDTFDPALSSMRDLVVLMLVAAISAGFVAPIYVGLVIAVGLLTVRDFTAATLHYWIGDLIGVLVVTPFALFAFTRRRVLPLSRETALQCAAVACALALVFGLAREQELQLFYVLFLPIIWMAVRNGTEGVSTGILLTQLGVILGTRFVLQDQPDRLMAFQALMLILAVTGLVAGELVTDRRRMESQLRLHQDSLARLARLNSVGELAAAIAHEVNQPLMAAGTYTRLIADMASSTRPDMTEVADFAKKAVAQMDRAAEVIRRLRALVRLDRSNQRVCSFQGIVNEAIELCRPSLDRGGISARYREAAGLPPLMVDRLEVEQVLINLIRNSVEAIEGSGNLGGSISIEAKPTGGKFVDISVMDTGPGFPHESLESGFLPTSSSKSDGLGLGLSLCRSIVEAHGGRLWLEAVPRGASIRFTLPIAPKSENG